MLKLLAALFASTLIFTEAVAQERTTRTPLQLCAAAINDPLRQMIIDTVAYDGEHLGGSLGSVKSELENDYGAFITVLDDATVEKVDQQTGKVGCLVTFVVDLQGLVGKMLEEGRTDKAQSLVREIASDGKEMRRRPTYTVEETSGGSVMVAFGIIGQPRTPDRTGITADLSVLSCDQLWFQRNAIFKRGGYCFRTARAISAFGNDGCRYDNLDRVPLSAQDQQMVSAVQQLERLKFCQR